MSEENDAPWYQGLNIRAEYVSLTPFKGNELCILRADKHLFPVNREKLTFAAVPRVPIFSSWCDVEQWHKENKEGYGFDIDLGFAGDETTIFVRNDHFMACPDGIVPTYEELRDSIEKANTHE